MFLAAAISAGEEDGSGDVCFDCNTVGARQVWSLQQHDRSGPDQREISAGICPTVDG
jgi:hypothetical protein